LLMIDMIFSIQPNIQSLLGFHVTATQNTRLPTTISPEATKVPRLL
jgi:hypothetical protein